MILFLQSLSLCPIMKPQPTKSKFSLLGITREYSSNASVHGVGYVFTAATAVERFIWQLQVTSYKVNKITISYILFERFLLIVIALVCAGYLTLGVYKQWQERPLVTSLKVSYFLPPNYKKKSFETKDQYLLIYKKITLGHEQASERHAISKHHHLHRGHQHGRNNRGDGVWECVIFEYTQNIVKGSYSRLQ